MVRKSIIPEPDTPAGILAAAEAEINEADQLAAEMEAAARAGDDTITHEALDTARKRSEWARIRRDAAKVKAAERAEELRRQAYTDVLAKNLDAATADHSAEIEALLAQARPFVAQAIELLGDRNKAVWMLSAYASDLTNYRVTADGLMGDAHPQLPGAAWFEYQGSTHRYIPATDVFKSLLKPLRDRADLLSGGNGAAWLSEI